MGKSDKEAKKTVNFYCLRCRISFNSDVGAINFETEDGAPEFEKVVICPLCETSYVSNEGELIEKFELTELG